MTVLTKPTNLFLALAWTAYLLFWVISAARSKRTERVRNCALTFLMVAAVVTLFLLLRPEMVPDGINSVLWRSTLPVGICADVVVLIGLLVLIWARRTLGANWSANTGFARDHELVKGGPYEYVRHPIYSGFLTMVVGTTIAYGHLFGTIILAVCTVGLYLKALREEAVLTEKFSDAYLKYKARTKALIPFLL